MVSQEMTMLGKNGCVIREIAEYSRKRSAQIGRENVFDFSIGNPSVGAPEVVTETLLSMIQNTDPAPPIIKAEATPTMFPTPRVPESATHNA